MKKALYGALCALTLITATGCTGNFALTHAVYKWQTGYSERWTNELCFIVSALFIYPLTTFVDAMFLNSMEFWTGSNPILHAADGTIVTRQSDSLATVMTPEGKRFDLARNSDGTFTLSDAAGHSVTVDGMGQMIAAR